MADCNGDPQMVVALCIHKNLNEINAAEQK